MVCPDEDEGENEFKDGMWKERYEPLERSYESE